MQFYLPQKEGFWYILALSFFLASLILFVDRIALAIISAENTVYIITLKNSLPLRFGVAFLLIACMSMISVLWYTFRDQKENEERRTAIEQLNKEAELFKLRQQLQPHFLFNSLNSISALAGTRPKKQEK